MTELEKLKERHRDVLRDVQQKKSTALRTFNVRRNSINGVTEFPRLMESAYAHYLKAAAPLMGPAELAAHVWKQVLDEEACLDLFCHMAATGKEGGVSEVVGRFYSMMTKRLAEQMTRRLIHLVGADYRVRQRILDQMLRELEPVRDSPDGASRVVLDEQRWEAAVRQYLDTCADAQRLLGG